MKEQFTISPIMKLERKDALLEREILFLVKKKHVLGLISEGRGKQTNKSKELKKKKREEKEKKLFRLIH